MSNIILESKGIERLMLSKNVNNKKCATKLVSLDEKKNEKDYNDFLTLKIEFESQILTLFETFPLKQILKI